MLWLLGRKSQLSLQNKVIVFKAIIVPIWTYGIQLWGCAKQSNLNIIQRLQNKALRTITAAPCLFIGKPSAKMENQTAIAASPSVPNSYAKAAQNVVFPRKDQAIVSDAKEGISIENYVEAIGKIVNPTSICFISRISNNRICTFLSSKSLVEELVEKHPTIKINNIELEIRPLINRMKRIILSNVSPIIPHNPENTFKLPEALQIQYDNTNYWIFISSGILTCFLCKQEGHTAKHCALSNTEHDMKNSSNVNTDQETTVNNTGGTKTSLDNISSPFTPPMAPRPTKDQPVNIGIPNNQPVIA
ncbi:hypothetical protein KPH14_011605 [Odynerus spinipes]|uniref:CCHC-type domain-containing protein n=1 Tax=Odynerus spinipes TaxID=1348599 RepID=A0AAD9VMF2_9HYME|nr:hypothetical protein KPH14_011605 [Odynerus spinipes]